MRPTVAALLLTLLLVVGAAALAGCGESKQDKAKAQVCDARDEIGKQIKSLQGLTIGTATLSKIQGSLTAIQSSLNKIADAQGDLSGQRKKDVENANAAFKASMSQIASSVGRTLSLQDAASQAKQALQQLANSYQASLGKIDCS
jgi:uncharacterized membrane-anchored protein YjiN (DUF445 family)